MNTNPDEKFNLLTDEIIELLENAQEMAWSSALKRLQREYNQAMTEYEKHSVMVRLKSWYAGMGSFSDLVLYEGGKPMKEENEALDQLRTRLFELISNR